MSDDLDLHEDYIPFSEARREAEQLFLEERFEESLAQLEKMQEMVEEIMNRG